MLTRLNAESHEERMVSVGSGVVGTKNTCMGSREIRNKVVLRGNYKFMGRVNGGEWGGGFPPKAG